MLIPYTDRDFQRIRDFARSHTGIDVPSRSRGLMYARLVRVVRAAGLTSFEAYLDALGGGLLPRQAFVDAITTHVTSFFREPAHFSRLEEIVDRSSRMSPVRRAWSAGCSTGEEAYTIAMILADRLDPQEMKRIEVVGTDIAPGVLDAAREGVYPRDKSLSAIPRGYWRFVQEGSGRNAGSVRIKPTLRSQMQFSARNLLTPWHGNPFDVVFCRNVLIYFSPEQTRTIVRNLVDALRVGGHLFLGHSEGACIDQANLVTVGNTTYRKRGTP